MGGGKKIKNTQREGWGGKEVGQGEVKVKKTWGYVRCDRKRESWTRNTFAILMIFPQQGLTYLQNSIKSLVYLYKDGPSLPLWCQNNDRNVDFFFGRNGAIQIRCEPCFGLVMEARLFKSSFCIQFGSFLMPCWQGAKWTQLDLGVFPGKTPRQRRWTHTKHLTHILMLTAHGSTLCICCVIVD